MNQPRIEIVPIKPAVNRDAETTLDVLIRVTAPDLPTSGTPRLPANLALVIDRSGSMGGSKLHFAREAAVEAVKQLDDRDRVSVVAFDDTVEVIVPSTPATGREAIAAAIQSIETAGSTALHAGWLEGGTQAAAFLRPGSLNRVILFTDGQANVGETSTKVISDHVRGLQERGVSTSAYGIGLGFNEDLLVAMAEAGDGNFEFIADPAQLPALLAGELQGLKATFGRRASLGLRPMNGVKVLQVLNGYPPTSAGNLMIPNLIAGQPVLTVARLSVPAGLTETDLLGLRVAWDDPAGGARQKAHAVLSLPAVSAADFAALLENAEVSEQVALLEAAREKVQVMAALDRGDIAYAHQSSRAMSERVASMRRTALSSAELEDQERLQAALDAGDLDLARKLASSQSYDRSRSKRRER
ncbi:MAG TPA: VWA domain-containing protein [Deinococcales bacterium]|nr:VWA domain-containing protein [Deinococcales bacterium]